MFNERKKEKLRAALVQEDLDIRESRRQEKQAVLIRTWALSGSIAAKLNPLVCERL